MSLSMVTEEQVKIYRDLIMEGDARCVGSGSSCMGASGRLCRHRRPGKYCRVWQLETGAASRKGGLRKCKAEERSYSTE